MFALIKEEWPDLAKVLGFNGITLGVVTLANVEALLKIALLAASIVYTVIKIRAALSGKKEKD